MEPADCSKAKRMGTGLPQAATRFAYERFQDAAGTKVESSGGETWGRTSKKSDEAGMGWKV